MSQLTPSQEEEEPPFLAECVEDQHQLEEEHDALTEHPAEGGSEEIVQQSSNEGTAYPVPNGSVYPSQEHNISQQESNRQIQVDEIVNLHEKFFPVDVEDALQKKNSDSHNTSAYRVITIKKIIVITRQTMEIEQPM